MWKNTEVTRRLKLDVPIVQGPFGSGLSAVDLVVAVSEGGGLGSFGVHHLDGAGIRDDRRRRSARARARTFALNLWIPLGDSDDPRLTRCAVERGAANCCGRTSTSCACRCRRGPRASGRATRNRSKRCIELRPPVFSFVFGVPSPDVLERCRRAGIATSAPRPPRPRPNYSADAGVDMIVATGFEAGGHRVSFLREPEECLTGTLALVPQVVDAVKVPVIAAGWHRRWPRHRRGARSSGAAAAQIGTAFLACEESNAAPLHREQAVQRRCAPHLADARVHRAARAQHPQRIHRRDARQGEAARAVSRCKRG